MMQIYPDHHFHPTTNNEEHPDDTAPGTVWFCTENDDFGLYPGRECFDQKSKQMCKVIGGEGPSKWDEITENLIYCHTSQMIGYRTAVVQYADGTKGRQDPDELQNPISDPSHLDAPPLSFLSYDDMLAMPDPQWLVDGVIQDATSALLFGKSNAFKSFLGIDLACSIATGKDWHGFDVCEPAPVLYVATEGSRGVGKQRIPGWMASHDIPENLRRNIQMHKEEIALDDDKAITDVLLSCAHWKASRMLSQGQKVPDPSNATNSVALVVIDIFGASMMGPETSDETARAWVRNVNRIMRETGCAVLAIAHTGWADDTRARMHTHFWGSFDTRLKAVGDKDSLTSVLSIDRHKDADSEGEWGFRMDKVNTPTNGTTLVPRLCDEVEVKQKRRVSGKPAVALQALSEALIDQGKTISGKNYPSCPVVHVEAWKDMCQRHGLTDSDKPNAARQAFHRAKATLIDKGIVKQFDGYIWKAEGNE